jgi:hypothetical protein
VPRPGATAARPGQLAGLLTWTYDLFTTTPPLESGTRLCSIGPALAR